MVPSVTDVSDVLGRLRATPKHFTRVADGLTDAQLSRPPAAGGWSATELLAHLRGAADVQGAWIAKMLADDTPTIRYVSARTGMRKHASDAFTASLRAYAQQRSSLVKTLSSLPLADWSRTATFTGTKPGWTPTVFDLASGIATHDQSHHEQIAASIVR
jgi:hypothetical protein